MKKLTLLLIPALLALSACKQQPVTPSGSSGEQPSSETSSSEEPRIPTIDDLIETSADGKYRITVTVDDYDNGDFHDRVSYRVTRDGDKLLRESGVKVEEEFEYSPEMYGVLTGPGEGETYSLINDCWVIEPEVYDEIYRGFGIFQDITNWFTDIRDGVDYTWTFNEETNQYHGESEDKSFEADVQLVPGFYSSFNVHMVYDEQYESYFWFEADLLGEVEVVLPEITANRLTDDMWAIHDTYMNASSFTMSMEEKREDYTRVYLYKFVYDSEEDTTTLKVVNYDETVRYYRSANNKYYSKTPDTDWEEIDEGAFEDVERRLYEVCDLLECPSPKVFAEFAKVTHYEPGDMQLLFEDNDNEAVTLKYDASTYELHTYITEKITEKFTYQYSDFNNTVID